MDRVIPGKRGSCHSWEKRIVSFLGKEDRVIPGKHHVGGSANTNPLWSAEKMLETQILKSIWGQQQASIGKIQEIK